MGKVNSGQSPLPEGMERWGLLGLGLFILGCGSFLLIHPKKSVELMFPRTEASCKIKLLFAFRVSKCKSPDFYS
jgi:hypothetical protein